MILLLVGFIIFILASLLVYIFKFSQKSIFTYSLIGIIICQMLWQGYIGVLYAVDLFTAEQAEVLFRLLRIGALATPTMFFLTITETLIHSQEKISFMNKIFTRRNFNVYAVITVIFYILNWTDVTVTHLIYLEGKILPHYYPEYGPIGFIQMLQTFSLLIWLGCAFHIAVKMNNEYLKAFHIRFTVYAAIASVLGLMNFNDEYVIITSLTSCTLFTVGVLYSFNHFREKVMEFERRVEIEKMKIEFVDYTTSSLIHEIKNPLTVLLGYFKLAEYSDKLDPDLKRKAEIMHNSTLHIQKVIDNFVDFISTREIQIEYECVNEIIEASIDMMQLKGQERGVCIEPIESKEDVYTGLDSSKLSQVFMNLYKNAIEAMTEKEGEKKIYTRLEQKANHIVIEIQDTGMGIHSDIAKTIFQPFKTGKQDGMGLGLSICKNIVLAHKGTIEVQETSENGTTFKIILPIQDYSDMFVNN
ncbi:GHKL domain-containing protein [Peribacillus saganii]|uniref:histidine kinase n=1 Tax=Peribacillus saganii TaxID=2303992 RepID=A0A372LQR2_9BACI|nr:sensor histidine kinase [Peribacillus saganii]RFU70541.1 GHKL domain-containing protein [Peribacillus saganii]